MYSRDKPFSIPAFLGVRTTPLIGTDVSTISLSTLGSGFGQFTHRTKVGTFFQADPANPFPDSPTAFKIISLIPDFVKLGTDPPGTTHAKDKTPNLLDAAILLVRDTVDQDLRPLVDFCHGEQ